MSTEVKSYDSLHLPPNVISRVDVARLVAEAERIDNLYTADAAHTKVGDTHHEDIRFTDQFAAFIEANSITLDDSHVRTVLIKELRQLHHKVPTMHMTFAVTADPEGLAQLTDWLRKNVHPQVVIETGLQPGLVAGAYVRTPNHIYDFSVRAALREHESVLTDELEALRVAK